jgi:S1-C subfamily serine protease
MNTMTSPPKQRPAVSSLIAAVLGGLVVLVIGAILIQTDVIDTGDTTRVVEQAPISQAATDPAATQSGRTVQDIYKTEGKGVVFIQSQGVSDENAFGQQQQGTATGSGFVVDEDGTIITNAHVVDGASKVTVSFEEGGEAIDADVKGVDNDADIAVLKINPEGRDLTVLPLGDSSKAQVGDPVVAIGNPFGLQRTVTTGIVSALQRQVDAPSGFPISGVIQTDASINPGNSGGPLLNARGEVIGINSQIQTGGTGQGSVGIGFAVPVNVAKKELPQLREGKEIKRAYLGVVMGDLNSTIAKQLGVPVDQGAVVTDVTSGSPADKANLEPGDSTTGRGADVIVAIDGKKVTGADDVVQAVAEKSPGDSVTIQFYRGKDKHTETLKLGERPDQVSSTQQSPNDGGGLPFELP